MGRNDIRIRRQAFNSGRIAQHRNYGEVMARHEKEVRLKRIFRVFMYFLIVLFIVMVYLIVNKVDRVKQGPGRDIPAKPVVIKS